MLLYITFTHTGLIFTQGPLWEEQRKFTVRHLRDLGFGKTSIENQIKDEINELINEIADTAKADPQRVVNFKGIFSISVLNVLWSFVGGKRFSRDDKDLQRLMQYNSVFFQSGNTTRSNIPVPMFILKMFPKLKRMINNADANTVKPLQQFIQVIIFKIEI